MNFKNKSYRFLKTHNLFFNLAGCMFLFLGFIIRYRVYSKTSFGANIYFLSGLLCLIFSCFYFFERKKSIFNKIVSIIIYLLFFISFVFLFFLGFYFFSSSIHEAKWLMPILSLFLLLFGIHTEILNNFLIFVYNGKTYKFAVSYEQFSFSFFALLITALLIYYIIIYDKRKKIIKQLFITFIYFLFRYIILIFVFVYSNNISIFYKPFYFISSILPLCFILDIKYLQKNDNYKNINLFSNIKLTLFTSILCCFTVSAFIYSIFLFDGSGEEKKGNIYIDEYHSDGWESVFEPLNTENFGGQRSTYTYFSFVKLLEEIKPVHIITKGEDYEKITSEDILIIKTPTIDFTEKEIEKIDSMLKNGGGVWIIGDHTNLLDMSSRLNKIIEPYGAKFNYDAVYDLTTSNLTYYDNNLMPLFKHKINFILSGYKFATSCSIKTSNFYNKIIIGNNLCSENLDLSHQNYFGDLSFSEEEYFGLFCQCASKKIEKGRLLIYSDSTTFSSFSVLMHTNPEFIFSSIAYLNKKNSFNYPLIIAFVLLLFFIISLFFIRIKINMVNILIISIILLPMFLIILSNLHNIDNIKFNQKIENKLNAIPRIYFIQNADEFDNELIVRWWSTGIDEYTSLFLAFQRLGFSLREVKEFTNSNIQTNLLSVIPKPINTQKNIRQAINYCKKGGRLLLFLSDRNLKKSLDFLRKFNIEYNTMQNSYKVLLNDNMSNKEIKLISSIEFIPISYSYRKSYFAKEYVNIRIDEFSFGDAGKIYVLINAHFFDNIGLGEAATVPTNRQIQFHSEFFDLIRQLKIE